MRQKHQSKQRLPKPRYATPSSTLPQPQPQPQQKTLASMTSTLASTMLQGFGFGVGSSVARKAVDHVFDSTTTTSNGPAPPPPQDKKVKCEEVWENYKTCLNSSSAECHHFFDDFSRCVHYDDKKTPR